LNDKYMLMQVRNSTVDLMRVVRETFEESKKGLEQYYDEMDKLDNINLDSNFEFLKHLVTKYYIYILVVNAWCLLFPQILIFNGISLMTICFFKEKLIKFEQKKLKNIFKESLFIHENLTSAIAELEATITTCTEKITKMNREERKKLERSKEILINEFVCDEVQKDRYRNKELVLSKKFNKYFS